MRAIFQISGASFYMFLFENFCTVCDNLVRADINLMWNPRGRPWP